MTDTLRDEPAVAASVRAAGERAITRMLTLGLGTYGPLDVSGRNWIEWALEEVADAQVYLACLAVRLERLRDAAEKAKEEERR